MHDLGCKGGTVGFDFCRTQLAGNCLSAGGKETCIRGEVLQSLCAAETACMLWHALKLPSCKFLQFTMVNSCTGEVKEPSILASSNGITVQEINNLYWELFVALNIPMERCAEHAHEFLLFKTELYLKGSEGWHSPWEITEVKLSCLLSLLI